MRHEEKLQKLLDLIDRRDIIQKQIELLAEEIRKDLEVTHV